MEGQTVEILDLTLQTAILTGLAQVNTPLEPVCPSPRCEYPDFSTLGICSSCEDVTDTAAQICQSFSFNETSNDWVRFLNDSGTFRSAHVNCSYISPSGLMLTPGIGTLQGNMRDQLDVYHIYFNSVGRKDVSTLGTIFMAKYNYGTPSRYSPENITAPEPRPQLTECSISLCEREYIRNHFSVTDSTTSQLSRSQTLTPRDPDKFDWEMPLIAKDTPTTFASGASYSIDWYTWQSLLYTITIFNTTSAQAAGGETGVRLGPILYNSKNITESFLSMATSMTDNMRSLASNGASQVPGLAFQTETYVHVRWPWIALPVALIVSSILLLCVLMVISRGKSVLWKSSILPLIVGRLEASTQYDIAKVRHLDDLQLISKKVEVVVKEDEFLVFEEQ